MIVCGRLLYISSAAASILLGTLFLKSAFVTSSPECLSTDFPCENGGCIDGGLWCDSSEDCSDGSDEKYCKKVSFLSGKDPNKCPQIYARCNDGPCIPLFWQCDAYDDCDDASDEENCEKRDSTESESTTLPIRDTTSPLSTINYHTTTVTATNSPMSQTAEPNAIEMFTSLNTSESSVQLEMFSGLGHSAASGERQRARDWLVSQRKEDFGWGEETARAVVALCLSDEQPMARNTRSDMLMVKQLEIQLALELAKNGTKPMKLTDLTLYINALLVSCKNPRNFYGDNLVRTLREGVTASQQNGTFVNPSIYLTLCVSNATTNDDTRAITGIILNRNTSLNRIDMQALALLTASCIYRRTHFLNASMYDNLKMEFLRKVNGHGFPGNVYEAAILQQALQDMNVTLKGLIEFVIKHQQSDGSFGDILSTYFVLPILAGRNIIQMNDHCGHQNTPDLIPLEVLRNVKSKKMHIHYSLNYGSPPEVTQTIQLHVTEGTNFSDMMRLAQDINPKYRFKLSENRKVSTVYSLGEVPNDVEKGLYWTLYKGLKSNSEIVNEISWVPYVGDIKNLILEDGDQVLYWYKPV